MVPDGKHSPHHLCEWFSGLSSAQPIPSYMAALGDDRELPSCLTAYGLPDWEIPSGVLKDFLDEAGNELSWYGQVYGQA